MNIPAEPPLVYPEALFQQALLEALRSMLATNGSYALLARFGLDACFFVAKADVVRVAFIEIKSFGGQRQGGVGFGNGRGEGPQVDLLLKPEDELKILNPCIRWVLARQFDKQLRPLGPGAARYALFTWVEAKAAAMGGVARGKQNNFRTSAFEGRMMPWPELLDKLMSFIVG